MTAALFAAFLRVTEVIRPAFDPRVFAHLLVVLIGWVRTTGRHAVTEALVVTGVAGLRDHTAFHRVFSHAAWDLDDVCRRVVGALVARLDATAPLRVVLDDTLAPHKGPHVFGLGCHLDAVTSTRRRKNFRFGHQWVVLSLVVDLPFAARPWALPVAFRLYRTVGECAAHGALHRTKTALARELIDRLLTWLPDRRLVIAADQAYANGTVVADLPARVVWVGALRPDAALTDAPAPGRKRGPRLPSPADLAADAAVPWSHTRVVLYGRARTVAYKTCVARWYRALGGVALRVVVVRCATGERPLRVFFCTDPRWTVPALLRAYGDRWPTEPTFRESKQLLGFAESAAWTRRAVERTAPMVGLLYTLLVVWFHDARLGDALDVIPYRPWYATKRTVSVADVVRAARDTFARVDLPAKLPMLEDFARRGARPRSGEQLTLPFAA
jgi:hypothetical protein